MMIRLLVLAVAFGALCGCEQSRSCKRGTVLLTIRLEGAAAQAERFEITAEIDGATRSASVAHASGATGTLELRFPPEMEYRAGQSLTLTLVATKDGQPMGQGRIGPLSLPATCGAFALTVSESLPDLAGADLTIIECSLPDDCPSMQYCDGIRCVAGCKASIECAGVAPATDGGLPRAQCNTTLHQCVECTANENCPPGITCSPSGACVIGCDPAHPCPGSLACCDGLCIDTTSDPLNCGGCAVPCVGAASTCCASSCVDVSVSTAHCGGCDRACSATGVAALSCSAGTCSSTCAFPAGNCVRPAFPASDDGCESNLLTITRCGACNQPCDTASSTPSGCASDGGAYCTYSGCNTNRLDCNRAAPNTNGCEVDKLGDADNCGGCGSQCDTTHSTGRACTGGSCTYSGCASGYGDCNNTSDTRNLLGCETPTTTSAACGGCAPCATANSSSRSCALDGGVARCLFTCSGSFLNCDPTAPNTEGCNINKADDENNCGACGLACDTTTGTPSCDGTTCNMACNTGRADCNATVPNTNGCECAISTTASNNYGTDNGTSCCGTGCTNPHNNGFGGFYYDCIAPGTYNLTQATKAADSVALGATAQSLSCAGDGSNLHCRVVDNSGTTNDSCRCWAYSGLRIGRAATWTGATTCFCPATTDPMWN